MVELQHVPGSHVGEVLAADDELLAAELRGVDVELVRLHGDRRGLLALPSSGGRASRRHCAL